MRSHVRLACSLAESVPGLAVPWRCPLCRQHPAFVTTLLSVVCHLQDSHAMSREWVADWLDSLGGAVDLDVYDRRVWTLKEMR